MDIVSFAKYRVRQDTCQGIEFIGTSPITITPPMYMYFRVPVSINIHFHDGGTGHIEDRSDTYQFLMINYM